MSDPDHCVAHQLWALIICKCGQSLKLGNQDKNILAEPVSQSPGLSGITDSVGCGNMEGIHSGKGAC